MSQDVVLPQLPKTYGIGLVGLGNISNFHRAGYRKFGLPVTAGFDPAPAMRERFAADEPGVRAHDSLDDLIADPQVEILDIVTPHYFNVRKPVVEKAAAAGKPVLITKPFSLTYAESLELVEILEAAGVAGMVNQNMCFTPGGLALPPVLVGQRAIGTPFLAQLQMRMCGDLPEDHWCGKDERWWTVANAIHHIALFHFLFGPPQTVYARLGHDPRQTGVTHDGLGNLMLSYANGMESTLLTTGTYYGNDAKPYEHEELWIQGPDGVIDWRPEGGFTVSLRADREKPEAERHIFHETPGRWFCDAFGNTMSHFQAALAAGVRPWCSVQDNLYVMAVAEAAYRSHAERRPVALEEIMGDRHEANYGPGWLHGPRDWAAVRIEEPAAAAL